MSNLRIQASKSNDIALTVTAQKRRSQYDVNTLIKLDDDRIIRMTHTDTNNDLNKVSTTRKN